ncbi:hypothetical protein C8J57DRAFT_1286982 [Mycena rebaudengoi]|nr:hypothetical protein C8J57DRAFT_1286982 [Mycena rebaudengoi]
MAETTSDLKMDSAATTGEEAAPRYQVHWFRSTIFQIFIVGAVFFCAPGGPNSTSQACTNALSSLGAGGLATPWYANATNAAGFAFMAFLCVTGGIVVGKIGVNASSIRYAGSLYLNSKNGTQWFLMLGTRQRHYLDAQADDTLGSIISGMTDGLIPTVGVACSGLWVFMRNAGPVIGGAIIFGLNHAIDSTGGVSLQTYLVIIGIMCAGPFISLLLSHPGKGSAQGWHVKIVFRKTGWKKTFILLLCPLFFTSWFYGSYIGTLQTQYMNVRTRSLCALVIPFGDIAGGFMIGYFLDLKSLTIKQRARWSFISLMVLNLALWVWTAVVTKQLEDQQPVIDWTSGSIFGSTFTLFLLFDLATMATQTSLYWIISQMSDDFIALSYMTGTLRGVECAGQAVAFGIKSTDTTNWLSIGLNIGLIVFSLPFAWVVIRKIGVVEFDKITFAIHADEKPVSEKSEAESEKGSV